MNCYLRVETNESLNSLKNGVLIRSISGPNRKTHSFELGRFNSNVCNWEFIPNLGQCGRPWPKFQVTRNRTYLIGLLIVTIHSHGTIYCFNCNDLTPQ